MNEYLIFLLLICFLKNSNSDYILPFQTTNIGINQSLLEEDFLSNILSRNLYTKFIIGSEKEEIKAVINMTQIGFYIYDNAYNYNSSFSFKFKNSTRSFYYKNSEIGYDANDTLCLIDDSNQNISELDIKKCNDFTGINFELLKSLQASIDNNYYSEYGIIGLGMSSNQDEYIVSIFMSSLQKANMINSSSFSFNYINNSESCETKGYLHLGEEYNNEEDGSLNKVISNPINGQLFWNIKCSNIYSAIYNSSNSSIYENYKEFDIKIAELIGDLPYIIGVKNYKSYITEYFFRELINDDICSLNKIKLDKDYSTFVCDNTSAIFRNKFENEFPLLKFEHFGLNKTFVMDQYDLFTYNYLDKSDKNIYFLVLFSEKKGKYNPFNPSMNEIQRWKLGIPFLKKYKLTFNLEESMISYYEPNNPPTSDDDIPDDDNTNSTDTTNITDINNDEDSPNKGDEKTETNKNPTLENDLYLYVGIGGGVFFVIILIVFGILCYNNKINCIKKHNETEIDDDYIIPINSSENNDKIGSLNNSD